MSSARRRSARTTAARGRDRGPRGQRLRGWCPRDDHVYPFGNGVCPNCGTSLVSIAPLPGDEHVEVIEQGPIARELPRIPTVRSPFVLRSAVVGLVLAAFLVGLFFPRGGEEPPGRNVAPGYEGSQSVAIGTVVHATTGPLLLSRLTQDRREFSATISVPEGSIDPSLVTGAAVEIETEGSSDLRTIAGVSDVKLTHHLGGFALLGRIPAGMGRIVGFRIASLQLHVARVPEWNVNISSIWPLRGAEPAVLHVGSSRNIASRRSLRLVAVLAWRDRIEVDLGLPEGVAEQTADLSIDGVEMSMSGEGDGLQDRWTTTLGAVQQDQISPTEMLVRFQGIPHTVRLVTIRAARVSRVLWGPWSWRIA